MAKDDNGYPVVYGVSHLDGLTPVAIQFEPTTRKMLIDEITEIQFDPSLSTSQGKNEYPLAKATSSSDNHTLRPWIVNAYTGALLISQ